jgi:hypothetical protein
MPAVAPAEQHTPHPSGTSKPLPPPPVQQAASLATPAAHVEQAASLATPAVPPVVGFVAFFPPCYGERCYCGAGLQACGRVLWGMLSLWGRRSCLRPAFLVEQAARLATPAVLPVVGFVAFFPPCYGERCYCGAGLQACGRVLWGMLSLWGRRSCLRPAFLVEQAARLAMPAVAPAEQHTPHPSGTSKPLPPPPVQQAASLATPAAHVEQAASLATPAVPPVVAS